MALPPSASVSKPRDNSRLISVLVFVICIAIIVGTWMYLRHLRAARQVKLAPRLAIQTVDDDAQAARAVGNYLAKMEAQLRERQALFAQLQKNKVFSWDVQHQAGLEAFRQMIQDFLAANHRLEESTRYGRDLIRAELDTAKVPSEKKEAALALYDKSQGPLIPLQLHVIQCYQRIGENGLKVLDLLEQSWGHWQRETVTGRLDFDSTLTQSIFLDYAEKAKAAAIELESAQRELSAARPSTQSR